MQCAPFDTPIAADGCRPAVPIHLEHVLAATRSAFATFIGACAQSSHAFVVVGWRNGTTSDVLVRSRTVRDFGICFRVHCIDYALYVETHMVAFDSAVVVTRLETLPVVALSSLPTERIWAAAAERFRVLHRLPATALVA